MFRASLLRNRSIGTFASSRHVRSRVIAGTSSSQILRRTCNHKSWPRLAASRLKHQQREFRSQQQVAKIVAQEPKRQLMLPIRRPELALYSAQVVRAPAAIRAYADRAVSSTQSSPGSLPERSPLKGPGAPRPSYRRASGCSHVVHAAQPFLRAENVPIPCSSGHIQRQVETRMVISMTITKRGQLALVRLG